MKSVLLALVMGMVGGYSALAQIVYQEQFSGIADGTTIDTGPTAWSTTQPGSGTFAVSGEAFFIYDTNSEGVWTSASVDISSYGYALLDISGYIVFAGSDDYLRFYYKINGGPEVLFGDFSGGFLSTAIGSSAIVQGSTVQVVVRGYANSFLNSYLFDDVTVTGVTTLYSRKTGSWSDVTAGNSTWSVAGVGGASCNCAPNNLTRIIVGSGNNVTMGASADVVGVTVQSGGQLTIGNGFELGLVRGATLTINAGGSLSSGASTTSQINFDGAYAHNMIVDGALTVGDIDINASATLNISGIGAFNVMDDFMLGSSPAVTNGMTGAMAIAGDLLFESSGSPAFSNAGTLSIAGDVSFDNDNASLSNSGTLTFSDIVVVGSTDNGNTITNSGTLTFDDVRTNNGNFNIVNNGTLNQSGDFVNGHVDTGSSYINTGTWNWSLTPNSGHDGSVTSVLDLTTVGNTFNYAAAGNQNVLQLTHYHLQTSGSGTKYLQASIDINGNLTVGLSTAFSSNSRDITLAGNWINNGSDFVEGTRNVTLDGTGTQTITRSSGETFYNLIIDKSLGSVTIASGSSVAISHLLTLTWGVVNTSSSALLTINNSADASSGNANSYVDGPIRKLGNSPNPFVFPTGDGSVWARIGINYISNSSATTSFDAQYFDATFPTPGNDGSLNNASGKEYWTLDRINTSATARVQLYWQSGTRSQITSVACCDLVVAKHNGTAWTNVGRSTISGTTTTGTVTSNTVSTFSPFTFGSVSAPLNPLPIELVYFKGKVVSDFVELSWKTDQELNNDYFTIERSSDAETFVALTTIAGKGTTNQQHSYKYHDQQPLHGRSYYRLKQTDYDGSFTYSPLIMIDFEGVTEPRLRVFPNPSDGRTIQFAINGITDRRELRLNLVDTNGAVIANKQVTLDSSGSYEGEFSMTDPLASGLYLLRADPAPLLVQKVLVE